EYKETWQDKLVPFGCLALLASLLFSAVVGLFTIWNWIF
ncbi:MAG TPA: DNA helicase, partial [Bacillus sp. (in: Bacteria)]|nr:DNA helicase [Bacillus sp. (in: firmicutes)]